MTLGQFTEAKLLVPRLLSGHQQGAIQELTKRLEATGRITNAPAFLEAVLKRVRELPTFVGEGVAVPHVRGAAVSQLSMAVGLADAGIQWGASQRHDVRIVVLFAVPLAEAQTYLNLLSGLSSLIQDEKAFAALQRARQPEEMLSVFNSTHLVQMTAPPHPPDNSALIHEDEPNR